MRRHLTDQTFVDLLDGTVTAEAVPHLADCAECRSRLDGLRAVWQDVSAVGVPEPSPLFWDHLSARVHAAVAAEAEAPRVWWKGAQDWRVAVAAGAIAAAVLALIVDVRSPAPGPVPAAVAAAPVAPPAALMVTAGTAGDSLQDDASLALVADLASELDWEATAELGLASRGGADRAVADMSDGERAELRRMLTEALGSGV